MSTRRGFKNGLTAMVHEEIVMYDTLFNRCLEAVEEGDDQDEVAVCISRLYGMYGKMQVDHVSVDWKGIVKSLDKSL